jgi:hypothetical protein
MITLISSKDQTKDWRKKQDWYNGGRHTECENYQKELIKKITNIDTISKTNIRINMELFKLESERTPLKKLNGFEYTENFDGIIEYKDAKLFFNLKFICDAGGAQTRSLREVYIFIKSQLNVLKNNKDEDSKKYFINILDGDTCFTHLNKFKHLIENIEHEDIVKYIFVGDMKSFQKFWKKIQNNI